MSARPRVEVHHGRRGRELRIDDTFASYYQPGKPVTRSVWDALAAPVLWGAGGRRPPRVLILGLGGGSAARLLRALSPGSQIVAVEYDPEVVRAAREHFDLDELGLEVVVDDAHLQLRTERRRFDLVIEDVFVGEGEGVHKPDWLPEPGHRLCARRVAKGGLLVSNALDEAPAVARSLGALFPRVVRIDVDDYDNRVFVAGPAGLDARGLRAAVEACELLAPTLPLLSFRTLRGR